MTDLKPCPFCGGEATLDSPTESDSPFWCIYSKRCDGNGCELAPAVCMEDMDEALAAWNRRADGWVSVEDGLPELEEDVCMWCPPNLFVGYQSGTKMSGERMWYSHDPDWRGDEPVTHWQPLPAPPETP